VSEYAGTSLGPRPLQMERAVIQFPEHLRGNGIDRTQQHRSPRCAGSIDRSWIGHLEQIENRHMPNQQDKDQNQKPPVVLPLGRPGPIENEGVMIHRSHRYCIVAYARSNPREVTNSEIFMTTPKAAVRSAIITTCRRSGVASSNAVSRSAKPISFSLKNNRGALPGKTVMMCEPFTGGRMDENRQIHRHARLHDEVRGKDEKHHQQQHDIQHRCGEEKP